MSILNNLDLIPIDSLRFHEDHDPHRLKRITNDIHSLKYLNNPPMVTVCHDNTYLILDGLHRAKSLIEMNINNIIVQKVDLDHPKLKILSWTHVIPDYIEIINNNYYAKEVPMFTLFRSNQTTVFLGPKSLKLRLEILHKISSSYLNKDEIERLPEPPDFLEPGKQYLSFQPFTLEEFKELRDYHYITPPGMTRLLIPDRLLNLKMPLHLLDQKDDESFQKKILSYKHRLRKYTEDVYILE